MNQKVEKPTLSGQRIKTRKRDEKEKFDPVGFRDAILQGFSEAGSDLDAISKYLDSAGSKLDYRRYGENLFDILIAGGLLAPGGSIITDAENSKPFQTDVCIFKQKNDLQSLRNFEQVFTKLTRRYKYLEKMLEDEMKKVLLYIRGFRPDERNKLAHITALWLSTGSIPPSVLNVLTNEHLVKDGQALDFLLETLVIWKQEKGVQSIMTALKKASLDNKMLEFLPPNRRSNEHFETAFQERGLGEIIKFHLAQANQGAKKDLQKQLEELVREGRPSKEVIVEVKDLSSRAAIPEPEVINIVWTTVMASVEWNKKEELLSDQAMKVLRLHTPLFAAFTKNSKSELALILKIQDYCYDNMNFLKVFHKIILLFYKSDVLSEEAITKWYKEAHSMKGKSVFLDQMKRFMEWLQNAEEESESGDDE